MSLLNMGEKVNKSDCRQASSSDSEGQWQEPYPDWRKDNPCDLEQAIAFLRRRGADVTEHSGRNLLSHLLGTYEILTSWDLEGDVCLAGLFHSVYGTASFHTKLVQESDRDDVKGTIGTEAELLAYLFCALDLSLLSLIRRDGEPYLVPIAGTHRFAHVSQKTLTDLVLIRWANWAEQIQASSQGSPTLGWLSAELTNDAGVVPSHVLRDLANRFGCG